MVLHYDGSLAGFLCLAERAIKERIEVSEVIRSGQSVTADLFNSELQIATDRDFAARVARGLESRLGKGFMTCGAQALFSEEEGIKLPAELPQHADEEQIASLWRSFYQSISNVDRHNPKLRQQFMPKMYWRYLTEMQT